MNINTLTKKYLAGEKLLKKEQDYLWKKLRDKCDVVFSKWIRNRDKNKDSISYWAYNCDNKIQNCCHWIPREWFSHRRDENNCAWGCARCNGFNKQEHITIFTSNQIKKFWQDWVDEQLFKRNKIKPSIDELLEIIKTYTIS